MFGSRAASIGSGKLSTAPRIAGSLVSVRIEPVGHATTAASASAFCATDDGCW